MQTQIWPPWSSDCYYRCAYTPNIKWKMGCLESGISMDFVSALLSNPNPDYCSYILLTSVSSTIGDLWVEDIHAMVEMAAGERTRRYICELYSVGFVTNFWNGQNTYINQVKAILSWWKWEPRCHMLVSLLITCSTGYVGDATGWNSLLMLQPS